MRRRKMLSENLGECQTYNCNDKAVGFDSNSVLRCEECLEIQYRMDEGRGYEELCENDDLPEDEEAENVTE